MTDLRQAAQQALKALKGVLDDNPKVLEASISGGLYEVVQCRDAITALRTALEQQAEPTCPDCKAAVLYECVACSSNNYPTQQQAEPPPEWPLIKNILAVFGLDAIAFVAKWKAAQRPWVGLTEFQFAEIYNKWNDTNGSTPWGLNQALEARLKELNT